MVSIASYLPKLCRHIEQYVALSPEHCELLASLLRIKRILKRQFLLSEGDICRYESFVVEGCLRTLYIDEKGIEHTLHFAVEGWWISDLESFLKQTTSHYHIEALENSIVLQIDYSSLESLYEKAPVFERYFRILHQNAFIAQSNRILQNISLPGKDRYSTFLKTYPQWHQRIPQKYIASYLGITPVFLSQIRKQRTSS
jgi:CRP-like cAMP-binding protein